jgi:DNA primase large subunit
MDLLDKQALLEALRNRCNKLINGSDQISYRDLNIDTRMAELNRVISEIQKGKFDYEERSEGCDNRS